MATPDLEGVYAIEVKGTLAALGWPRLKAGDIPQLTSEWLAKPEHFGRRQWKSVKSDDLETVDVIQDESHFEF